MKGQWGKLVGYVLVTALATIAVTLALPLIGGAGWLPELITREGERIDDLFWGLVWMSIIIFALVAGVVLYCMVNFRAAPGDMSDGEHIHGNAKMETAWIVIPTIIVTVIGVMSYVVLEDNEIGLYDEAAAKNPGAATMVVDVRAFSFGWAFRYADTEGEPLGATGEQEPSSQLVLPVDEVVKFNVLSCSGQEALGRIREVTLRALANEHGGEGGAGHEFKLPPSICEEQWDATTEEDRTAAEEEATRYYEIKQRLQAGEELSAEDREFWEAQPRFRGDRQHIDVNHAFWVPEARLKIDAVFGIPTYVQWEPVRVTGPEDRFHVVCAELCGTGHNAMRTEMCVVDQGTFEWWTGLAEEERADANCQVLRLMTCLGEDPGDRDQALTATAALYDEFPDAGCDDVEEQVA